MTTRKLMGENKQDLLNILNKQGGAATEGKYSHEFLDKARVLLIMILCFGSKIDELKEYLDIVESIHT
jgi:hypothetical protein